MTITLTVSPGGVLKREIVDMTFDDLGVSDYEPDEAMKALQRLNTMMMESPWSTLGYEQPTYGAGLLTDESGVDRTYLAAVAHELALRSAPGLGKTPSAMLLRNATTSRRSLPVIIPSMSYAAGVPAGAGNRDTLTGAFAID